MSVNQRSRTPGASFSPPRRKMKPLVAGLTTLTLGVSGIFLVTPAANAAPGYSEAEARYLSGTLLGASLDELAALGGERAVATENTAEVVTESGDLDLSVLGNTLTLEVADGVNIPLSLADAGVVGQYAQATQEGTSRAAAGAVTDGGIIDVTPRADAQGPLTLDLSDLIGSDLASSFTGLALSTGVNSASAENLGEGASGDYSIAELQLSLTSPVIAGISSELSEAGDAAETSVNGLLGPDGTLLSSLTDVVGSLSDEVRADAAFNVELTPLVDEVLEDNQILGVGGPVQMNLTNGNVTVNVAALLEANGRDLNDLGTGEEILTSELVGFITAEVDSLVNGLIDEVNAVVTEALEAATLTVNLSVGPEEEPLVTLALDGTLGAIATDEVSSTVTIGDVEFEPTLLTGLIDAAVNTAVNIRLNTEALDGELDALYPVVDELITQLVSLQGNVQESDAGRFTQTALRLTLLSYAGAGDEALALNLAQASVGPNAIPTDDTPENAVPSILSIAPTQGPEAGGTSVVIRGTGLTGVESVVFGGATAESFVVNSDTQLTAVTPAGVGTVDVTVLKQTGISSLDDAFTYVEANDGSEGPVITDVTPANGTTEGGTVVTITGDNFTGAEEVIFGDLPGTNVTVISDSEIRVTAPPGEAGLVDVTVITPEGSAAIADGFTYVAPDGGDDDGGTTTPPPGDGDGDGVDNGDGDNNGNGVGNGDGNGAGNGNVDNSGDPAGVDHLYADCDAVDAAGVGPLSTDDPGYRLKLDGDGDGTACEDATPRSLAVTGGTPIGGLALSGVLMVLAGLGAFVWRRFSLA